MKKGQWIKELAGSELISNSTTGGRDQTSVDWLKF